MQPEQPRIPPTDRLSQILANGGKGPPPHEVPKKDTVDMVEKDEVKEIAKDALGKDENPYPSPDLSVPLYAPRCDVTAKVCFNFVIFFISLLH